jgi:septal ring factor EnvC (AmiA/AmiB activator)
MAQDFAAAFGMGEDDSHISTSDSDRVALAAIQGLNQKLAESMKERDAKIEELESRNAKLEARLAALEQLATTVTNTTK